MATPNGKTGGTSGSGAQTASPSERRLAGGWSRLPRIGGHGLTLLLMAVTLLGAAAIFAQSALPPLCLATPLTLLVALAGGLRRSVAALAIIAATAFIAAWLGRSPFDDASSLMAYGAILAITALPLAEWADSARRDRAALAIAHDETRRLRDTIEEVIFEIDREGRWSSLNAAWERITGFSCEESLGRPVEDFLDALECGAEREKFTRLIKGERGLMTSLHTIRRPDGDTRHVEVRLRGAFDLQGCPVGLVGHIRDITQAARYRHALEDAERRFSTLANAAPVGIWRTNARGDTLFVNEAFKGMTGLRDGQWEGSHWITAIHPDDFDRVVTTWKAVLKAKAAFRGEWRWRRADGSVVWVATSGAPQLDEDGRVTGYIGMNVDISQQRGAEAQLAENEHRMRAVFERLGTGAQPVSDQAQWEGLALQLRQMVGPQGRRPDPRPADPRMRAA